LLHELAMRWRRAKEVEAKRGNPGTETNTIKGLGNAI